MIAEIIPIGGTTGLCHEATASIEAAAQWLLSEPDRTGQAIVPEIKQRFGLTTLEAVEAIREANRRRPASNLVHSRERG